MFDFERHDILEPDAILASQFFSARPALPEPEHALFVAVLDEASRCLLSYCTSGDREKRALYMDAERWFLSTDEDDLFTFASVCTVLGLDAGTLRRNLLGRRDRLRSSAAATQPARRRRAST